MRRSLNSVVQLKGRDVWVLAFAGTTRRGGRIVARRPFYRNLSQQKHGTSPMDIVPLGPEFAAELRGATLADIASSDAAYAAARAAFKEH